MFRAPALLVSMLLTAALWPVSASAAPIGPDQTWCVSVPGTEDGSLPFLNITNTGADGAGYGTLRKLGAPQTYTLPASERTSSVNFAAGTPPNPNLAVVESNEAGVCYDTARSAANVILDLTAVVPPTAVRSATAARILDTRSGGLVTADTSRCVAVPDATPGDTAIINITNTAATGRGYGSLRASNAIPIYDRAPVDQYSSVNFAANTPPNPNLAVTAVGLNNQICYDGAVSSHHVILDLNAVLDRASVSAVEPQRILDTRSGGLVTADTSRCVAVPGATPGDTAIINITNTAATGRGYGSLRASNAIPIYDRAPVDQYSSVNFAANTPPNPNLAVTAVGLNNQICYDGAVSSHHVILDLVSVASSAALPSIEPTRILDTRRKPGSLTRDEVLNQTLPTGTCGQIGEQLGLQLRDGEISGDFATSGSINVSDVVQQDFDGDGLDDAAYVINCFTGGSGVFYEVFLHHAGSEPIPIREDAFIGSAASSDVRAFGFIEDFRLSGPSIAMRWSAKNQSDPNCCASLLFESQIFSNGQRFPTILTARSDDAPADAF